tara:strand:- start:229 stop:546 length:318 start_codon:yes stop_codon:yes gene_type:complete
MAAKPVWLTKRSTASFRKSTQPDAKHALPLGAPLSASIERQSYCGGLRVSAIRSYAPTSMPAACAVVVKFRTVARKTGSDDSRSNPDPNEKIAISNPTCGIRGGV